MSITSWIGVDLDGTLATYDGWKGVDHIGEPIPLMTDVVHKLIRAGWHIKIFTARVHNCPEAYPPIQKWCVQHLGYDLPITNVKDQGMIYLIDDRVVAIEKNTGKSLSVWPREILDSLHKENA